MSGMSWIAWKMLTGDRAKYYGLILAIAFSTMLMSQQMAIFCGLMIRTTSQIQDVTGADYWVMDPAQQNGDEIQPLSDFDLYRVRGVSGVSWAARLYKGLARVRIESGSFRTAILMGLDDTSLAGAPRKLVAGSLDSLRQPDAILIDDAGYDYLWPNEPIRLGRVLYMNDRRAVVVGVCKAGAPFQTFPVVFTRYSQATQFVPRERNIMAFILARSQSGINREELRDRIEQQTGLMALTPTAFAWRTIWYYIGSTGIPVNFFITVMLGFIVGTAVSGQTFYLFTLENLKQFGALKAMGVANSTLLLMLLQQAATVAAIGYCVGLGLAAGFFEATSNWSHLRGFYMPWQVAALSFGAVVLIVVLASCVSINKVWRLEPAIVFKG